MTDGSGERKRASAKRHLPVTGPRSSLRRDGGRNVVYPADVSGRFARARTAVFVLLIAFYAALPWVQVGGHPAVFLDVMRREFFLFGRVFNAQDIWMMVFLVTGVAFALVVTTAVAGRVWCGWACPQTVFLEGVFRRVERVIEGSREVRMRRNAGPWTWDKAWRKVLLHAVWILCSLVVAHIFLAYFVSLPQLLSLMRHTPREHPEAFAIVMALSGLFYFNFSWFREQFCVVLCPYGRLQSVLLDPDSLIVGYDVTRGEPRGKAHVAHTSAAADTTATQPSASTVEPRVEATPATKTGDCVDCLRCVVVCPTGIDIRNGLQMDCLACTACIDACDDVMTRLHRPTGLIRYDSQSGLSGQPRRVLRPRLAVYAVLGLAGVTAATYALGQRREFEANVLRVTGAPYTLDGAVVRNALHVHIVSKLSETAEFRIEPVASSSESFIVAMPVVRLAPLGSVDVPVFVSVPRSTFTHEFPIRLRIYAEHHAPIEVRAPFVGPTP